MPERLINDVIKPWVELNTLSTERFAVQPERSDLTRLASALAVAIKHQADHRGMSRSTVDQASPENSLMSDVADAAKHGQLGNPHRRNSLYVAACFEFAEGRGFRFIRNQIVVAHASVGEFDFLMKSLRAIHYWLSQLSISLQKPIEMTESSAEFTPTAWLHYNPDYSFQMAATRFKFLSRQSNGKYLPIDPPEVKIEIHEFSQPK